MMESRLITINSAHRTSNSNENNTTNFSVDLLNATPEIRDRVLGVSVETVGFVNHLDNVYASTETLYVTRDDVTYSVTLGVGLYNYVELADRVTEAVTNQLGLTPGEYVATAHHEVDAGPATISHSYTPIIPGSTLTFEYVRQSAAHPLGYSQTFTIGVGLDIPFFRPNLYGPMAVVLHTRALAGSRSSVDGLGAASATIMTIPIQVPYGRVVSMHMGGEERPSILYSEGADRNLTNIDVSLRHLDGSNVDIGTGEMYVTFRVWIRHV
jgi:hypothetical protein